MSTVNKSAEIGPPQISIRYLPLLIGCARISVRISQVSTKLFMKGPDGRNPSSITYQIEPCS